jgi:hypothetical protein
MPLARISRQRQVLGDEGFLLDADRNIAANPYRR